MDAFDDIAGAAWAATKTPLDRMYDAWLGDGWDEDGSVEFPTVNLLDRTSDVGLPVVCSCCGRSDRWAPTHYGKWRCAREHEPVWIGRGYIEQVIEVGAGEVVIGGLD